MMITLDEVRVRDFGAVLKDGLVHDTDCPSLRPGAVAAVSSVGISCVCSESMLAARQRPPAEWDRMRHGCLPAIFGPSVVCTCNLNSHRLPKAGAFKHENGVADLVPTPEFLAAIAANPDAPEMLWVGGRIAYRADRD